MRPETTPWNAIFQMCEARISFLRARTIERNTAKRMPKATKIPQVYSVRGPTEIVRRGGYESGNAILQWSEEPKTEYTDTKRSFGTVVLLRMPPPAAGLFRLVERNLHGLFGTARENLEPDTIADALLPNQEGQGMLRIKFLPV